MAGVTVSIFGGMILTAGIILNLYWSLRFMVVTYRHGPFWFFGCLFVPLADCLFVILYFKAARKSFFLSLLGLTACVLAAWMAGIQS